MKIVVTTAIATAILTYLLAYQVGFEPTDHKARVWNPLISPIKAGTFAPPNGDDPFIFRG